MKKLLITILLSLSLAFNVDAATVTKSIGSGSRDYSTVTLWEADLDNVGVYATGDDAVDEMYNDSAFTESNATVTIDGGGTVGLNSVKLSVASGQRHDGTAGTGARFQHSSGTVAMMDLFPLAGTNKLIVEWLEVDANGLSKLHMIESINATNGRVPVIQRLLVHGPTGSSQLFAISCGTRDALVQNNIIYDIGPAVGSTGGDVYGINCDTDQANGGILNNTVFNVTSTSSGLSDAVGIRSLTDDVDKRVRNNISMETSSVGGIAADFTFSGSTNGVSSNNLSEDATADDGGGSDHQISKTVANQFVSTTGGSEDLHLKTGSDAIDTGVDLATTPTGVNFDIDNRDRDAQNDVWDIGADEFVAVAVAAPSRTFDVKARGGVKVKGGVKFK